jgi:NAD kinase
MALSPRVVVVHRHTEMEQVVAGSGTPGQARFRAASRGRSLGEVERGHSTQQQVLQEVAAAVPADWRRGEVERADLDRFVFGPEDVIVVVGQDGLVANVAKYLEGQPVLGINPDPQGNDGVLCPHPPQGVSRLLEWLDAEAGGADPAPLLARSTSGAGKGRGPYRIQPRTMVRAELEDGQRLLGLNEVFAGHRSHQSARYRLRAAGREERQSSSGLLCASGTGSTGWARSIARQRGLEGRLPEPEQGRLAWLVREPFPSVATGVGLDFGLLAGEDELEVVSEMPDDGVVFADGIERDALEFVAGQRLRLGIAPAALRLVVPA